MYNKSQDKKDSDVITKVDVKSNNGIQNITQEKELSNVYTYLIDCFIKKEKLLYLQSITETQAKYRNKILFQ